MALVVMKKRPTTSEQTNLESAISQTDGAMAVTKWTHATRASVPSKMGLLPSVSESAPKIGAAAISNMAYTAAT